MHSLFLKRGIGLSEIFNLLWENVNLRERYIELVDQKNGEHSTMPLNQTAIDMLRSVPRRADSRYIFPGKIQGKPFCDVKRKFEKAIANAELQGVAFHILRHMIASHLVMAGADLVTTKETMRHKSIETTMRYAHLSPEHKKSAIDALEAALIPKAKDTKRGLSYPQLTPKQKSGGKR